jgi:hypothetical protein
MRNPGESGNQRTGILRKGAKPDPPSKTDPSILCPPCHECFKVVLFVLDEASNGLSEIYYRRKTRFTCPVSFSVVAPKINFTSLSSRSYYNLPVLRLYLELPFLNQFAPLQAHSNSNSTVSFTRIIHYYKIAACCYMSKI